VPFFEPSAGLAEKGNERFKDFKYLVVGQYDLHPVTEGKHLERSVSPHDSIVDRIGREQIIDTDNEVTVDEFLQRAAADQSSQSLKEEHVMPRLNLKDDALDGESSPLDSDKNVAPPPTLRDVGGGGGRSSPLLLIVLIIFVLAAGVFALNYFKVIHLWGKKAPKVAEVMTEPGTTLPEPEQTVATDLGTIPTAEQGSDMNPATPSVTALPEPTPTPTPTTVTTPEKSTPAVQKHKASAPPPSGTGRFTVQVSSWTNKEKAEAEASRLSTAGFSAFVENAMVGGETWHRVRVGRYASSQEAQEAASQVQKVAEDLVWVTKTGSR
jgi:cell division septation protein DedD